jgi:hypothetical protein
MEDYRGQTVRRGEIKDWLADVNPDALVADGFDDALIGWTAGFGPTLAVYDRQKCIQSLMANMTEEEAEDFFEFNCAGAYVGENGPLFIELAAVERQQTDDREGSET